MCWGEGGGQKNQTDLESLGGCHRLLINIYQHEKAGSVAAQLASETEVLYCEHTVEPQGNSLFLKQISPSSRLF